MQRPAWSRAALEDALAAQGLQLRGGFVPLAQDALPALPQDGRAAVVWLVGQAGSTLWPAFAASGFLEDGLPDPLDRWSKSIGNGLAQQFGGTALYPSDGPPFYPFQQWARRTEGLHASPLMLQLHPRFGLWHAYRFALVLPALAPEDAAALARQAQVPASDLCLQCDGQPCLSACPVDAFDGRGYAIDRCAGHIHRPAGQDCMGSGCLARLACPVGVEFRYVPEHAAFHMAAFAQRH